MCDDERVFFFFFFFSFFRSHLISAQRVGGGVERSTRMCASRSRVILKTRMFAILRGDAAVVARARQPGVRRRRQRAHQLAGARAGWPPRRSVRARTHTHNTHTRARARVLVGACAAACADTRRCSERLFTARSRLVRRPLDQASRDQDVRAAREGAAVVPAAALPAAPNTKLRLAHVCQWHSHTRSETSTSCFSFRLLFHHGTSVAGVSRAVLAVAVSCGRRGTALT